MAQGLDLSQMSDDDLEALYYEEKARVSGKKLTTGLQKAEDADREILQSAQDINARLGTQAKRLSTGELNLGPWTNLGAETLNFLGRSNENSRNYASFRSDLEKMRNDSLRLNKGVQTEGDAVRAWNELFKNLNDEGVVNQRLDEIEGINNRAIQFRSRLINDRRRSQGVPEILIDKGTLDNPYDLSKGQSRLDIPQGSYYRDPQGNIRRNDNFDAGNPIKKAARPSKPTPVKGSQAAPTTSAPKASIKSMSDADLKKVLGL